ncbi:ABC transporter ATP-binding protein [Alicyclobacillus sp. SO9]|uniref:ABC transporter ATP-binding protein n=1 Tax=Alicyclobacillus sp. SO9 TaxID=2665646 RepID=UPI0018E84F47|nr:ABC transporter ATP-binding protein [Alicyclobacillus sp. SO9]QQE76815.1 ABC transporter ATP-binding protein [Alicyclobacillus sp. SO9]
MTPRETLGPSQEVGDRQIFARLLSYLRPHWKLLLAAVTILLLATSSDVVGPILIKVYIDNYLRPRVFPALPVTLLGGGYLFLQVAAGLLNFVQLIWFQKIALKVIQRLRVDVFSHLQYLGLAFFDRKPAGSLVSRITNDTEAIKELYVSVLSTFVQSSFLLIGIFVSMFVLDARLAALCLVLVPVIFGIMQAYRRFSAPVFLLARHKLSALNAKLSESLQGMYLIQAMRQQQRLKSQFEQINDEYKEARLKNVYLNGLLLRPLVDVVYLLTLILILSVFGVQSFTRFVDIGVLYAFVNYLDRFFEPVNQMMMQLNMLQQAIASSRRVFELLDETEFSPLHMPDNDRSGQGSAAARTTGLNESADVPAGHNADPRTSSLGQSVVREIPSITNGEVCFDGVDFSYDGKTQVLKNITFTAHPGQTVAIVGHTGSGKSSIINLLLHFYEPSSGTITIDGHPLNQFSKMELRSKLGLVLQDAFLFAGDVKSNIRLGRDISDNMVQAAAEFVQAHSFIQRLPHAYEEQVGERGTQFSGGQRQLLSFARTMADEPRILVLDEATSSIDTETEQAIQLALERMQRGRTTIAIAHRLSTIQDADLILVLHHGEIIERGTHQELLSLEGLYHKMYLLQQGGRANNLTVID